MTASVMATSVMATSVMATSVMTSSTAAMAASVTDSGVRFGHFGQGIWAGNRGGYCLMPGTLLCRKDLRHLSVGETALLTASRDDSVAKLLQCDEYH